MRHAAFVLLVVGALALPAAAGADDPSKITATCFASSSSSGPFSSTNPVTVVQGQPVVFALGTKNDDAGASAVYTATFTFTMDTTFFWGAPHTIHTKTRQGGAGLSTGGVEQVNVDTTGRAPGKDEVVVTATSDKGSGELARCDFDLTILGTSATSDADSDGLLDTWETAGYDSDADGTVDVTLPGSNATHKDLYVEMDWLPGHAPSRSSIQAIKTAFAAAPVNAGGTANPDGQPGINLHVDTGSLKEGNNLVGDNLGGGNEIQPDVDIVKLDQAYYGAKKANFAANRSALYRYAIMGDPSDSPDAGGWGEIGGNDEVLFRSDAAGFMHELGHNLNLDHGGPAGTTGNCKPNHISVMNYSYAFGIPTRGGGTTLDFSPPRTSAGRAAAPLPTLVENALDETTILDSTDPTSQIVFTNGGGKVVRTNVDGPVDWNGDGDALDNPVTANVDVMATTPPLCANTSTSSSLPGADDWSKISLPFRQFGNSNNGPVNLAHPNEDDPTAAQVQQLEQAVNTTDVGVTLVGAPQMAAAGSQVTYTVTVANAGPNPASEVVVNEELPAGTSYVSDTGGCTRTSTGPDVVSCPVSELAAGASRSLQVVAAIAADLVFKNGGPLAVTAKASVTNSAGPDPIAANDSASASTNVVARADLGVSLSPSSPTELMVGQSGQVMLRHTVTNAGPSSPIDVHLTTAATPSVGLTVTPSGRDVALAAVTTGTPATSDATFTVTCSTGGLELLSLRASVRPERSADTDPVAANDSATATLPIDCVVPVVVNILPGSKQNPVNLGKNGVVPLAVLTTSAGEYGNPAAFDATRIDVPTVRFGTPATLATGGGSLAKKGTGTVEDSYELDEKTKDRDLDMVFHFEVVGTGLTMTDALACVRGTARTLTGVRITFYGCDAVRPT